MRASALRSVVLVCVAAFVVAAGCGDDEPPKEKKKGDTVECGGMRCDPVLLPPPYESIPACCPTSGGCGLNGEQFEQYGANFEEPCQPVEQPGNLDPGCDDSTPVETDFGPLIFDGCCTAAGRCGYMVNTAFIIELGLGCVDAQPFLEAGVPENCTPGAPGGGGAGGGGP